MRNTITLLFAGVTLCGCSVLGNRYSAQYEVACRPMNIDALRSELQRDADRIAAIVGQPVRTTDYRLQIMVPYNAEPSFWRSSPPLLIQLLVDADVPNSSPSSTQLLVGVYRPNDPEEDDTIIRARHAVETVLTSSACPSWKVYINRFSTIG